MSLLLGFVRWIMFATSRLVNVEIVAFAKRRLSDRILGREDLSATTKIKKAPEGAGATRTREMRSGEFLPTKTYLLSAMGLAPRSRRPFTAVRAARAAGMFAAAAP